MVKTCEQLGGDSVCIRHDITDLEALSDLVNRVENEIGPLDILVNNAGIHLKKAAVDTLDEELAGMMQTHVFASYALSREFGRKMMERGRGSILMVLSMASLFGIPQVSAYTAAKSAMLGLTRSLAVEFSPHGVRVNAVAPGWIETDMSRKALEGDSERRDKILSRTPLGRLGNPTDIGYAAVYLCSPAADFVTGTVLTVDGGVSVGF
jgi:gluconate 5-dehydrogenase